MEQSWETEECVAAERVCPAAERVCPHRLVGLEGGLELQVVPVSQDVGEGRLVRAESAFSSLERKT